MIAGPRFELIFTLDGGDVETTTAALTRLADTVEVVPDDGGLRCHVHVDDIGGAVESVLDLGRPRDIRVIDLRDAGGDRTFHPGPTIDTESTAEARLAPLGVVVVTEGQGLVEAFRASHAQVVVVGSPDLVDLVAAVDAAAADSVLIVPNDPALVAVAHRVDELSTKDVAVVPTRSVQQGLAAMMGYSLRESNTLTAVEEMSAAASSIVDGRIVRAPRDARVPFGRIAAGDWVGVADGTVVTADADLAVALRQLVAAIWLAASRLTVHTGVGSVPVATKSLEAWVADVYTGTEVVVVDGGHPTSPYLVTIE